MGVMLTLLSLFETRNSFLKLQCIGWGVIVIGLCQHPQCDIMLKAGSKSCCGTAARWATSSTRSSTPCTSTAPPSSASTLGGMLFMIWKAATRMVCKRMEAVQDDWATRGNGAREGKSRKGSGHRPHIHTLTLPSPWLNLTWLYAYVEQCQEVTIPARSLSWPASRTNTTRCLQSIWKWTRTLSTDEVYCWKAILSSIKWSDIAICHECTLEDITCFKTLKRKW